MCHANLQDAVAMTALMEVYSTLPQWDSHRFLLMLLRVELEGDSFCHSKAVEIIQKLPQQRVASDTLLRATAASLTAWIATRGGSKGHENTHHVAERAEVLVDLAMATKLPDAIVAIWATQLRDTWKALNEDRWHHWDDVLKKLSPAPVEDARKAFSSN